MYAGLGWRWTQLITSIIMAVMVVLDFSFINESYPPILLVHKACRLRLETRNWSYHAQHEEQDATFREMITKFVIRPIQLLMTPICFFSALHASFGASPFWNAGSSSRSQNPSNTDLTEMFSLRHRLSESWILPKNLPGSQRVECSDRQPRFSMPFHRRLPGLPCEYRLFKMVCGSPQGQQRLRNSRTSSSSNDGRLSFPHGWSLHDWQHCRSRLLPLDRAYDGRNNDGFGFLYHLSVSHKLSDRHVSAVCSERYRCQHVYA